MEPAVKAEEQPHVTLVGGATESAAPAALAAPVAPAPPAPPAGLLLAEILSLAPVARDWAQAVSARPADFALALDLGARVLQAVVGPAAAPSALRSMASADKGAKGEDEVYDALARTRRVRDVSRRAHSGDLVCDSASGPVLVEVKHYANSVPSAEVDKFLRDLRERGAAAGAMLSLTSPIVGQKESIVVVLDPHVETGTLVPVVFASPGRGADARLHRDIAVAAVDTAVCLAEVYPRGLCGLHGRDSVLAYAVAADQLADGAHSVRTDLARLAARLADDAANLGDRLASLGREARALAKGQRAEAEELREAAPGKAEEFAASLRARFEIRASDQNLVRVIAAIEETSVLAGVLGERNRWRLLKARAVHVHSECGFAFLKGATEVRVPLTRLKVETVAAAIGRHAKKVRVADGEIALELDDSTVDTILAFVDAV